MKVLVVGREGQVARALAAASSGGLEIVAIGRPALDLADAETIRRAIAETAPHVVVNAAAYTAVDKAESEPAQAHAVNAAGAGSLAAACNAADVPVIHISTDYVYDGSKAAPYVESDAVRPLGVYGATKLAGEQAVAAMCPRHVILRTAWVYSPYGQNFVKTMLRLAATRPELGVVADQQGNPTYAPHLAQAIVDIARQVGDATAADGRWGVYHAAGAGETTWCDLAREVFAQSAKRGGPVAKVNAITTAEYPTPARRPANSRLDCGKLERTFGVRQPEWRTGVAEAIAALVPQS
ncbi:MAG: dTDP-4-dehydrorhamnose reductase [Hyphomicrobiaceae bacterium]